MATLGTKSPIRAQEVSETPLAEADPSIGRLIQDWLVERLGLRSLAYPIPAHANGILYALGGITLVGFVVLAVTGVYLAQFYHPTPSDAYASVTVITTTVPLGDLARSIHYWAAMIVTITVSLHLIRVFLSGAYKAPREITWLVGLGLLAITMGFVFTGTVLKWDQEGVEALAHNEAVASLVGGLGGWFSSEFSRSVPLVTRVFFAHVSILPALFTGLLAVHLGLVKAHGLAPLGRADWRQRDPRISRDEPSASYGEPVRPFTSHLRVVAGWGALILAITVALATAFPAPLGPAGHPGIEVTKPPMMFWWLYAAEDLLGARGLLVAPIIFFALLALPPFVDRGRERAMRRRKGILVAGLLFVSLLVALTLYTALTPPVAHIHAG